MPRDTGMTINGRRNIAFTNRTESRRHYHVKGKKKPPSRKWKATTHCIMAMQLDKT
jgi:hypothetical protein